MSGRENSIKHRLLISFIAALLVHGIVWQLWETDIIHWGEQILTKLRGRPINQAQIFDSSGVPVQVYGDQGKQYNPLFIAVQAKQDFKLIGSTSDPGSASARKSFISLSQWLLDNAIQTDSTLILPYGFDFPKFKMKAPWTSGLAQAVAMTVFAQRASIDPDPAWKDAFHKTLHTLKPGSPHTLTLPDSSLWFMEYPGDAAPYALSGMISTLLEIDRCYKLTHEPLLRDLFDRGYRAVIGKLPGFDRLGFSIYSLGGTVNGRNYHQRYYHRLLDLNALRPNPSLRYYATRWKNHDMLPVLIQLLYNPRPRRVAAVIGTLLTLWALIFALNPRIQRNRPVGGHTVYQTRNKKRG